MVLQPGKREFHSGPKKALTKGEMWRMESVTRRKLVATIASISRF
jgi:hypothetical protein